MQKLTIEQRLDRIEQMIETLVTVLGPDVRSLVQQPETKTSKSFLQMLKEHDGGPFPS